MKIELSNFEGGPVYHEGRLSDSEKSGSSTFSLTKKRKSLFQGLAPRDSVSVSREESGGECPLHRKGSRPQKGGKKKSLQPKKIRSLPGREKKKKFSIPMRKAISIESRQKMPQNGESDVKVEHTRPKRVAVRLQKKKESARRRGKKKGDS